MSAPSPKPALVPRETDLLHALQDRAKELTALHQTARVLQDDHRSVQEVLGSVIALLPPAWQYPESALGTGMLWFGWYGFNAGSELRVDHVTSLAFINTDTVGSFAAITWLIVAWIFEKKPKFLGLLTGSIAGLACITPAAGYVSVPVAALIGVIASLVCYVAINLKNKLGWDDALDVLGVHGVGGTLGVVLLGVFAEKTMNESGADGLLRGGGAFFVKEVATVAGFSLYAFVLRYAALVVVNKFTPVRASESEEEVGLDNPLHGEEAHVGEV